MEKPKAYPAKLRRPINLGDAILATLGEEQGVESFQQWLSRKQDKSFCLLFAHYGIKPDTVTSWKKLALALATTHVPAFQISDKILGAPRTKLPSTRRRGRPKDDDEPVWRLIHAIEVARADAALSKQRFTDKDFLSGVCRSDNSKKMFNHKDVDKYRKLVSRVRKTDAMRYQTTQREAVKAVHKIRKNSRS